MFGISDNFLLSFFVFFIPLSWFLLVEPIQRTLCSPPGAGWLPELQNEVFSFSDDTHRSFLWGVSVIAWGLVVVGEIRGMGQRGLFR